jgi:hypothetical protein
MSSISVFRALNLTGRLVFLAGLGLAWPVAAAAAGGGPGAWMPKPDAALALRDGRFLHLAPLPFGVLAGVVVGDAKFDTSGTRALVIATFPGAGVHGDWRSANPTQAFLVDAQRRSLTQLTVDGRAVSSVWNGGAQVSVREGDGGTTTIAVPDAQGGALPPGRWIAGDEIPSGSSYISGKSTDRMAVYKARDGRYVVVQVGARRFRVAGTARNGAYAIVGSYLAWIDGQRHISRQLARFGPDNAEPISFAGSPYGDALAPIVPLGSPVYQAAYRNGVAYFAFAHGVERIVAATNDLVNYWYPKLPHEPVFTVGDGLGASPDGALYFFRPEEDVMLFTHSGRYVRASMTGLDAARDPASLLAAIRRLGGGANAEGLSPMSDALDNALLQWRFYPVGDASGERWIVSHLGRVLVGDRRGRFAPGQQPAFPFAVLGRTDDGRLWGAAPTARRTTSHPTEQSALWSSRDGVAWRLEVTLTGSPGAVGSHNGTAWLALTQHWYGLPSVYVARLDANLPPTFFATAGTYAGEQLSFADLSTGFYLLWGATPGRRLAGEGGPLCGFRVDAGAPASEANPNFNPFLKQRFAPDSDPSLPGPGDRTVDAAAFLEPTLALPLAHGSLDGTRLTLRTNVAAAAAGSSPAIVMGLDQERAFELKYAGRPYPLATVIARVQGDTANVSRSLEYGPLRASGTEERWDKDASGAWRLRAIVSRFSY